MAKLVEILAKELGEWPVKAENICQDANGCAYGWYGTPEWDCTYNDEWLCTESADVIDRVEVAAGLATDHATAIVTREMWQAERERAVTGMGVSGESVGKKYMDRALITMRDRIREIDATIEAMTAERAELVSKLDGEGFALIAVAAEPVEDMSDWRDWRVGDRIEVLAGSECDTGVFAVIELESSDYDGYLPARLANIGWPELCYMRWHSRPTS